MAHATNYPNANNLGSKTYADTAMELGEEALDRTKQAATAARNTVEQNPMATLAIVAGLAFAAGALWKIGRSRPQTHGEALLSRVGELRGHLPRNWRW